LRSSDWR